MAILEPFALAIGFLLSYLFDFTNSYGFSIVILTVIINIVIFPLTLRQTRSTKRMQDAQSDIKKIQKEYKDNKEELNKAMAAMYKEKGINPLGCILPIIIQIQSLQADLIQAYEDANAVGCGTTVASTTYQQDVVTNRSQNINSGNYTGTDPFGGQTSANMSAANVGVGTLTVHSANGGTGIGTAYAGISSCYNNLLGCDLAEGSVTCAGWASTITAIENQITALRNQLPTLISDTNRLKSERRELEVIRYGDLFIIGRLQERKVGIGTVVTTTQEYSSNN